MKTLILTLFALLNLTASGQRACYIDRSAETEILFDEFNPRSLVSVLRNNLNYLGYYHPEGIGDSVLATMNGEERAQLIAYYDQFSTYLLINEDPESPGFGDPLIVFDENGVPSEVYSAPDTIYLDLTNIARMVVRDSVFDENSGAYRQRVEFWKRRRGELFLAAAFDSDQVLKPEGFHKIEQANAKWRELIMKTDEPRGIWVTTRDSSLIAMQECEKRHINDNYYRGGVLNDYMEFFSPTYFSNYNMSFAPDPALVENAQIEERTRFQCKFEDYAAMLPFSFALFDSVRTSETFEVKHLFDSVHYLMSRINIPLSDMYGEDSLLINEMGEIYFVYPPPQKVYFWIDYEPMIFFGETLVTDSAGILRWELTDLYFALNRPDGKPELVSHLDIRRWHPDFVKNYSATTSREAEYYGAYLRAVSDKKKRKKS